VDVDLLLDRVNGVRRMLAGKLTADETPALRQQLQGLAEVAWQPPRPRGVRE
jgi:hypothetical protein